MLHKKYKQNYLFPILFVLMKQISVNYLINNYSFKLWLISIFYNEEICNYYNIY